MSLAGLIKAIITGIVVGYIVLVTSGCASPPAVAPRFSAPSTAPIARAQAQIAQKQQETKGHIQKAEQIVRTLTIHDPQDKVKIDALSAVLDEANASNDDLKLENDSLKTDNDTLTAQLTTETQNANKLAADYDTLHAQNDKAQAVVKQVNKLWGLGGIAYGFGQLAKHLFILVAVLAVLAVAVLVLSFFFPFIIPFIRAVGSFFAAIFNRIGGLFRR